jgi:(2Fe-2S) ferredoxin
MSRGAQDVFTELASAVERAGLSGEVVQTQSGCVGPMCGSGPTVCCYPSGAWYGGVRPEDADEIVSGDLAEGRPVERLLAARLAPGAGDTLAPS